MYSCLNLLLFNQFNLKCYYDLGNNGKKYSKKFDLVQNADYVFVLH